MKQSGVVDVEVFDFDVSMFSCYFLENKSSNNSNLQSIRFKLFFG